jgi:hypothetical protein
MHVLLEYGDVIKETDEVYYYRDDTWVPVISDDVGEYYDDTYVPIRRKIDEAQFQIKEK